MRLPTRATDPQGAVLSAAADQTLSSGHIKAAGPMSSEVVGLAAVATEAAMARTASNLNRAISKRGSFKKAVQICLIRNQFEKIPNVGDEQHERY